MSVVSDVYAYLEAQGLAGGSTGWTLVRRRLMDAPAEDQLVAVQEDGGLAPESAASAGIGDSAMQDIGVQVMVRAVPWDGDACAAKAQAIFAALHGQRDITLGSTLYYRVRALTPEPIFLGFDDRGRPRHTISFYCLTDLT